MNELEVKLLNPHKCVWKTIIQRLKYYRQKTITENTILCNNYKN